MPPSRISTQNQETMGELTGHCDTVDGKNMRSTRQKRRDEKYTSIEFLFFSPFFFFFFKQTAARGASIEFLQHLDSKFSRSDLEEKLAEAYFVFFEKYNG
jgi:hypothetical protein